MTGRVWRSVYDPTKFIGLDDNDFEALESSAGLTFQTHQRDTIERVLNEYHSVQMMEWESPRANKLRPQLKKLARASAEYAKVLRESRAPSAKWVNEQVRRTFDGVKRQGPAQRAKWIADSGGGSLGTPLHANMDFDSWVKDAIGKTEFIGRLAKWVERSLPTDRGGRSSSKHQFDKLVFGLGTVYAEAGGKFSVSYADATGGYRVKGFLALVHGVQNHLPPKFRYEGTALGKVVQKLLSDYRSGKHTSAWELKTDTLLKALQGGRRRSRERTSRTA